ncbi:hypothetical protein Acid345_3673 [Candidatus Koribacter versatilis Ellin345]|uniref:Uncharacterized protein n=1 Tax=Koribacter versatilis (strain Ellin345) TaxID=204669 RepID=Q1IKC6_KORVE|nr:hypothetical protein [Candidatus Koribacter versatilis]ABF42674.1 hypothetical protein Acid345_3673 [Candidatus Koribacter versatilis Ellin345]
MNRYDPKQPIEPFYVPAKVLKCRIEGNEPGGGGSSPQPKQPLFPEWEKLEGPVAKLVGAAVFAGAYVLIEQNRRFLPIAVFLLLCAVLLRFDERRRRIAVAPLLLATLRLASQMSSAMLPNTERSMLRQAIGTVPAWVPLFLGACLFFGPNFKTVTQVMATALSSLLLFSGLLPGDGYLLVFVIVEYLLFVAMGIALIVDLLSRAPAPQPAVAR